MTHISHLSPSSAALKLKLKLPWQYKTPCLFFVFLHFCFFVFFSFHLFCPFVFLSWFCLFSFCPSVFCLSVFLSDITLIICPILRTSSLKSHSLCQNSKVAATDSISHWPRSGIELPGQLKNLSFLDWIKRVQYYLSIRTIYKCNSPHPHALTPSLYFLSLPWRQIGNTSCSKTWSEHQIL